MNRFFALSIIEAKFLQGIWLTRKEIMALTNYCADVTHIVRGLRERGVPVSCLSGKPANKSKRGVLPADLINHTKKPFEFRAKILEHGKTEHKINAIKKVRKIQSQYGDKLIMSAIGATGNE